MPQSKTINSVSLTRDTLKKRPSKLPRVPLRMRTASPLSPSPLVALETDKKGVLGLKEGEKRLLQAQHMTAPLITVSVFSLVVIGERECVQTAEKSLIDRTGESVGVTLACAFADVSS